jgi:hypothetical protein
MTEVSQEAREAAAKLFPVLPELGSWAERSRWADEMRDGELSDDPILQAFARFEQSIRAQAVAEVEDRALETAAKAADYGAERARRDWRDPIAQSAVRQVSQEIAEVIRSYQSTSPHFPAVQALAKLENPDG